MRRRLKAVGKVWGGEFKKLSAKTRADLSREMGRISARTGELSSYKLNNKWNKAEAEVKRLTGQIQSRELDLYRLKMDQRNDLKRLRDELVYSPTYKELRLYRPERKAIKDDYRSKIRKITQNFVKIKLILKRIKR